MFGAEDQPALGVPRHGRAETGEQQLLPPHGRARPPGRSRRAKLLGPHVEPLRPPLAHHPDDPRAGAGREQSSAAYAEGDTAPVEPPGTRSEGIAVEVEEDTATADECPLQRSPGSPSAVEVDAAASQPAGDEGRQAGPELVSGDGVKRIIGITEGASPHDPVPTVERDVEDSVALPARGTGGRPGLPGSTDPGVADKKLVSMTGKLEQDLTDEAGVSVDGGAVVDALGRPEQRATGRGVSACPPVDRRESGNRHEPM